MVNGVLSSCSLVLCVKLRVSWDCFLLCSLLAGNSSCYFSLIEKLLNRKHVIRGFQSVNYTVVCVLLTLSMKNFIFRLGPREKNDL